MGGEDRVQPTGNVKVAVHWERPGCALAHIVEFNMDGYGVAR